VREGWVTPPTLIGPGPPPRKPVMKLHDLLRVLESDREDRCLSRQLHGLARLPARRSCMGGRR
jgi:hypothetical protein